MRLSNSELISLLKRALEGSGWNNGRYEEAAYAIWWLESRGISWLDDLANVWPRLFRSVVPTPELIKDHMANSVIDAGRSSLLHCGPNSIDLAYANACSESLVSVETRHCLDRIMILPGLAVLSKRGASAMARWYSNNLLHIATIRAGSRFPTYTQYAIPEGKRVEDTSLYIICSCDLDGVNHYRRNMSKLNESHNVVKELLPEHFAQRTEDSLADGIHVLRESVDILNKAGDRVLVEATDQSRTGAG